jgi:hypothetical protein
VYFSHFLLAHTRRIQPRFRAISSFGADTIRKFSTNTSELKKLAARDFENLLQACYSLADNSWLLITAQCANAVFDGLLPEPHNRKVQQLLFTMAHWHGLAKLRVHTDQTLDLMDTVTVDLGKRLRSFQKETCSAFKTHELRRERDARLRRHQKKSTANRGTTSLAPESNISGSFISTSRSHRDSVPTDPPRSSRRPVHDSSSHPANRSTDPPSNGGLQLPNTAASASAPLPKTFNLNTYKVHALGDYTSHIRRYGTTDSYSTEVVRVAHYDLFCS